MTIQGRFWFRYGSAAAAALLAFMLSFTLYHYFGDRTFTVIYLPVILFAAFAGGLGPAVFATVLCLSISAFLLRENLFSNPENFIDAAFFAVLGPIVGVVGRRLLQESEDSRYRQAQLQSILDTVPEAMVVIDERRITRSMSATGVRTFCWD